MGVWMWPCKSGNKRQFWSYNKIYGHLSTQDGAYCLDARQRMTQGGYVHMWTCLPGEKNQEFHMLQNPQEFGYRPKMDYSLNILETGTWHGDQVAVFAKGCCRYPMGLCMDCGFDGMGYCHSDKAKCEDSCGGVFDAQADAPQCLDAPPMAPMKKSR